MVERGNTMNKLEGDSRDKRLLYISIFQNGLILLIIFYFNFKYDLHSIFPGKSIYFVGILLFVITAIISQIPIFLIYKENHKIRTKNDFLMQKVKSLEEINHVSRIQRHDLKNHLTVIQGLTVKNKTDILKNYMNELIGEVQSYRFNIDTGINEIDIIMESKYYEAKKNGIKLDCHIEDKLLDISINPFDLVKVISNIVDNAIDELKDENIDDKKIIFSIQEKTDEFAIAVSNNGKKIPDKMLDSIFKKGVSTKSGPGRGYGLYIVNNTVKKAKGGIKVESDETKTKFIINMPKARVENLANA